MFPSVKHKARAKNRSTTLMEDVSFMMVKSSKESISVDYVYAGANFEHTKFLFEREVTVSFLAVG